MNDMSDSHFQSTPGCIVFPGGPAFAQPMGVRAAQRVAEVQPALAWAEAEVAAGRWVAGYIAYEAAPAFEPALAAHPPGEQPLVWLASYGAPSAAPSMDGGALPQATWEPGITREDYARAFAAIRERIAAGDTYQVNYTFPLHAAAPADPWGAFCTLYAAQPVPHAAYLDTGRWQVLSLSPELFFRLEGDRLTTRPMKGTRPRGPYAEADADLAAELAASVKDRAENVMITDMLRNDMARVAAPGSVTVERLFEVERYATVWQMTSTIHASTTAAVPEIFAALFPSGSVTGAPKIETSKIIRALEPESRGVYCGAIGWWSPDGRAEFNVAIRTITIDRERGTARYPVGSGITWDAAPDAEFQECLDKAAIVLAPAPPFLLIETLRREGGAFWLLEEHLARLEASARHFDYAFDREVMIDALEAVPAKDARVRLTLNRAGVLDLTHAPLDAPRDTETWCVALASAPIDPADRFLYHKTTHRAAYTEILAAHPGVDDVILFNTAGELTESTKANLCLEIDGRLLTPARRCGLLGGTLRTRLLREGTLEEAVLRVEDLQRAQRVFLLNSVRGRIAVAWAHATPAHETS